jgi:uncharacterized damage-inducible protein DinB
MTAKSTTAKDNGRQAFSIMLIARWEQAVAKLAGLAQEFPEEKYETSPVVGVRTFGDVLRHVAFWNQYVADTARGSRSEDTANELPRSNYATKARVLAALKSSSDDAISALREHQDGLYTDQVVLAQSFIEHICEHYGQLAVYARWAGIVPPASRQSEGA